MKYRFLDECVIIYNDEYNVDISHYGISVYKDSELLAARTFFKTDDVNEVSAFSDILYTRTFSPERFDENRLPAKLICGYATNYPKSDILGNPGSICLYFDGNVIAVTKHSNPKRRIIELVDVPEKVIKEICYQFDSFVDSALKHMN